MGDEDPLDHNLAALRRIVDGRAAKAEQERARAAEMESRMEQPSGPSPSMRIEEFTREQPQSGGMATQTPPQTRITAFPGWLTRLFGS